MEQQTAVEAETSEELDPARRNAVEQLLAAARGQMALYDSPGWEKAVSILICLLQRVPDCAPACAALAECYAHWGFRRELDGLEAVSYYGLALEQATRAVELAPLDASAHRALAIALRRGPSADPARRQEEALVALDLDPKDAANWYEYWRAFGYNPGDPAVTRALELDPRLVGAAIDLGVALCEAGRLPEAQRYLERALELSPHNSLVHYDLAMVLDREGRLREARAMIEEALAEDPENHLLKEGLAILTGESHG